MVSFSQPTLHDLSMKVCTKTLKPSTLTFSFATENVLLQRINFHSRQKPFAFHSTSHSSLPVSADSYVAREPRGVHSCLILSRNLIGQRENKRFYVTEIVFADVSLRRRQATAGNTSAFAGYSVLYLYDHSLHRQLAHKHIVAFHGVAINVRNHELLSLKLVFDLCTGSLKNYIFKNDNCIPWKTASAVADTLQWTKQILDALEFIHGEELVHRDLKLDNILVSYPAEIKYTRLTASNF